MLWGALQSHSVGEFRTQPPEVVEDELVLRSGLLALLAARHDHRLTTVTGGPGFGKTTLLAQAVVQNRLVPAGRDAWVACYPGDADAHPLAAAMLDALGALVDRSRPDLVGAVADAMWSHAPIEVALILDDFHHVPAESEGRRLVADLARVLPANGHLVVVSRTAPTLATERHRAAGELIEIGEEQLAFDSEEQQRFAALHGLDAADFDLRWPALAQLTARAGADHALSYVWEEVLSALPVERRRALAQLSAFDEIDDDLVGAVTGTDESAASLIDGLPLVARSGEGTWRLHELWRRAFASELAPAERRCALVAGAHWLLGRDRLVEAASAFVAAADDAGLRATAEAVVARPLTVTDVDDARQIYALLPVSMQDSAVGALLSAFAQLGRGELRAAGAFERAAELACAAGHATMEARALWLATQLHGISHGPPAAPHLQERTRQLAATGLPAAQAMVSRHCAYVRLAAGDPDGALDHLGDLEGFGERLGPLLKDVLLLDAGRPEQVGAASSLGDVERQTATRQLDVNLAVALWLRGDVDPAAASSLTTEFLDVVDGQSMPHQSFLAHALEVPAAIAAGDEALAARCLARAEAFESASLGVFATGNVDIARAAWDCAAGDETAAADRLARLVAQLPIEGWVPRTYHHALAAVYLLVPAVRAPLDGMALGPSLRDLLRTARALADVRSGHQADRVLDAPWDRPNLLRSGLWPSHLAELVVAATATGRAPASVEAILAGLPSMPCRLKALRSHSHPAVAAEASRLVADLVPEPGYGLSVQAFGPLVLLRDGQPVTDPGWARRERVRRLLAYLIEHRSVSRRRAAAELWPDHDPDKGLLNLRVTLSYLQRVLEPDREEGAPSWFLSVDDDEITLHPDRISVDSWQFDVLIGRARQAGDRNVPSEALARFREAVALFGGDYLAAWEDEYWGSLERLRYRSQFAQAANRAGELLLAKGEPEAALDLAGTVLAYEQLSERAHRLRIRALLGCDDRAGARRAGEVVVTALADASMRPEPDTASLLAGLGLDHGHPSG